MTISMNLKITDFRKIPQWDQFVLDHPNGTILHTSSMIRCKESTRHNFPFAQGAIDSQGQLCAILVASRVVTMSGIGAQIASRSIMYAEPLCLNNDSGREGVRALINAHDLTMSTRTLFAEVRPVFECEAVDDTLLSCGYSKLGYLNYEMELCSCPTELFQRLGSKRRNNVRSAERKGVRVEEVTSQEGLADFYSLVCASYSRSKLPVVDQSLFTAARNYLSDGQFRVFTAFYQGTPVASACFLAFKKRVICWYAGTMRLPGIPAMTTVFWQAMKEFAMEGYELFDFAGGGWEGQDYGPGKFKARFGGNVTNHGRYRKVYSPWKLRVATAVYDRVRQLIAPKSTSVPIEN